MKLTGLATLAALATLATLGGVAGLTVAAALAGGGRAATHRDAAVSTANPMAEIADVYAWMNGSNLNLVMDVSPMDDGTRSFDPTVLYVFHLTSKPATGIATYDGVETQAICKFTSDTSVQCWVTDPTGTKDFVSGDPSDPAGVASLRGKVKVFAGRRSDPAFFNQAGFTAAVGAIKAVPPTMTDAAGCPFALDAGTALSIRNLFGAGSDAFASANVMAIVVQVDKSLVNIDPNTTVAVWGSTHAGS